VLVSASNLLDSARMGCLGDAGEEGERSGGEQGAKQEAGHVRFRSHRRAAALP
jgi:hypothetical protein